jgi:hypothetical protein
MLLLIDVAINVAINVAIIVHIIVHIMVHIMVLAIARARASYTATIRVLRRGWYIEPSDRPSLNESVVVPSSFSGHVIA